MSQIRAFTLGCDVVHDVLSLLVHAEFDTGESSRTARMVLDTFDGRLYRAGAHVEWVRGTPSELALYEPGRSRAAVPLSVVPRFAADLPVGPLRSRLTKLTGVRALMTVVKFSETTTPAVRSNSRGDPVAEVRLHLELRVGPATASAAADAVIEVVGLPGHDRAFERTCRMLREAGVPPADGSFIELVIRSAGADPRGVVTSATVPLSPTQPAQLGFRTVLANLAHTIEVNWQGTLEDTDTEFLHELRVAVRQTRTVLAQSKGVVPERERQRFINGFRLLAGLTSTPRDLDVLLLNWPGYMAALASELPSASALQPLHDKLVRERRHARRPFVISMQSDPTKAMISSWNLWLTAPPADACRLAATHLGPVVAGNVTSAHRRLVRHGRRIDDHSAPEALHELRKDAKRLRYQIECFASLFPRQATAHYVRRLKQLQDNLGEYQDVAVQSEALRVAVGAMALGPAFTQLTAHLETRRLSARAGFAEQFAAFDTRQIKRDLEAMTKRLAARSR